MGVHRLGYSIVEPEELGVLQESGECPRPDLRIVDRGFDRHAALESSMGPFPIGSHFLLADRLGLAFAREREDAVMEGDAAGEQLDRANRVVRGRRGQLETGEMIVREADTPGGHALAQRLETFLPRNRPAPDDLGLQIVDEPLDLALRQRRARRQRRSVPADRRRHPRRSHRPPGRASRRRARRLRGRPLQRRGR